MGRIELLDCTLRDGGYINNWEFGEKIIKDVTKEINQSGVGIVEIGFLRDEETTNDRAVWNNLQDVKKYIPSERNALVSIMGEIFNPYPLDRIPIYNKDGVDVFRIICWRKLQKESMRYCKELIQKGYKVCIQPDRVNQYTIEEFKQLCTEYATIHPYAIYVVDSNGFLSQKEILKYMDAADSVLPKEIKLGYHGHNSIMQAEGAAELIVERGYSRDIIIDGSVYGIGRASGNLNIEILAKYLNENVNGNYNISCFLKVYDNCIKEIYEKNSWGYSIESYLSSLYRCNPNYASILHQEYDLTINQIEKVINMLSDEDKIITNRSILPELIGRLT